MGGALGGGLPGGVVGMERLDKNGVCFSGEAASSSESEDGRGRRCSREERSCMGEGCSSSFSFPFLVWRRVVFIGFPSLPSASSSSGALSRFGTLPLPVLPPPLYRRRHVEKGTYAEDANSGGEEINGGGGTTSALYSVRSEVNDVPPAWSTPLSIGAGRLACGVDTKGNEDRSGHIGVGR